MMSNRYETLRVELTIGAERLVSCNKNCVNVGIDSTRNAQGVCAERQFRERN
jgi:hypothetical protein